MRNDKLIPGTILVIIGILFLLDNFGTIDFDWFSLIHLWPILLVMAGVNLVFAHNRTGTATAIKIAVLVAGMVFLIVNGLNHPRGERHNWTSFFGRSDDKNFDVDDIHIGDKNTGHYTEAYKPVVKQAILNINGGATSYTIKDTTNNLFDADTREFSGNHYNLDTSIDTNIETLNFGMNGDEKRHNGFVFTFGDSNSNKAFIKLNTIPVWEINVEAGVAKTNFDLSAFKVQKLKIEGGVASFRVKMGQPLDETNVEVSTGVSRITIDIPKNAACHISSDAGISSKRLDGFQNVSDNEYQTPGFENAKNKLYIKLSGGLSKFRVNQY